MPDHLREGVFGEVAAIDEDAANLRLKLGDHDQPRLVLDHLDRIRDERQHHARDAGADTMAADLGDGAKLRRVFVEERLALLGVCGLVAGAAGVFDRERHPDAGEIRAGLGARGPGRCDECEYQQRGCGREMRT